MRQAAMRMSPDNVIMTGIDQWLFAASGSHSLQGGRVADQNAHLPYFQLARNVIASPQTHHQAEGHQHSVEPPVKPLGEDAETER